MGARGSEALVDADEGTTGGAVVMHVSQDGEEADGAGTGAAAEEAESQSHQPGHRSCHQTQLSHDLLSTGWALEGHRVI